MQTYGNASSICITIDDCKRSPSRCGHKFTIIIHYSYIPTALMMNSEISTVNSETPTARLLAVIITIPSLFALILVVALTITIIVIVNKKWNN